MVDDLLEWIVEVRRSKRIQNMKKSGKVREHRDESQLWGFVRYVRWHRKIKVYRSILTRYANPGVKANGPTALIMVFLVIVMAKSHLRT